MTSIPGDGADEAEVEDEADGHDGAVEREEDRLPPAHPPHPRRKVRLGALHLTAPIRHDDGELESPAKIQNPGSASGGSPPHFVTRKSEVHMFLLLTLIFSKY